MVNSHTFHCKYGHVALRKLNTVSPGVSATFASEENLVDSAVDGAQAGIL
jgi:hypothetical protein